MPALFKCNECGFATRVKDELAGKRIKCPKCQAVGSVAAAAAKTKPVSDDESSDNLLSMNLDSFQDAEVPEGEILDESQKPSQPKVKKKKKKKGKALESSTKLAAIAFSLLSLLVIAGLVYSGGPVVMEQYQAYLEKRNSDGEDKPAANGQVPAGQEAPPQ